MRVPGTSIERDAPSGAIATIFALSLALVPPG